MFKELSRRRVGADVMSVGIVFDDVSLTIQGVALRGRSMRDGIGRKVDIDVTFGPLAKRRQGATVRPPEHQRALRFDRSDERVVIDLSALDAKMVKEWNEELNDGAGGWAYGLPDGVIESVRIERPD